jgi:hypothetical protein
MNQCLFLIFPRTFFDLPSVMVMNTCILYDASDVPLFVVLYDMPVKYVCDACFIA